MKRITLSTMTACLVVPGAVMLSGCQGILSEVYDEPQMDYGIYERGQLYIDASDWGEWHYIDLKALAENSEVNPDFNPSSLWETHEIPVAESSDNISSPNSEAFGIYTYRYDIFGLGISNCEYRGFYPTEKQPEPDNWTLAVHRNNVRTNGCGVYETSYTSIAQLPSDTDWMENLALSEDQWNQTDVWAVQDKMLSGLIGNQGIYVNNVLSGWLDIVIPPMPPSFALNNHVFILRLKDGSFAALQLADYMSASGTKCCLTINYKYPL